MLESKKIFAPIPLSKWHRAKPCTNDFCTKLTARGLDYSLPPPDAQITSNGRSTRVYGRCHHTPATLLPADNTRSGTGLRDCKRLSNGARSNIGVMSRHDPASVRTTPRLTHPLARHHTGQATASTAALARGLVKLSATRKAGSAQRSPATRPAAYGFLRTSAGRMAS